MDVSQLQVSALSVRIDVDMSAFVEAMEEVAAMFLTVAEYAGDMAKDIARSFGDITSKGEDNKSFWAKFGKDFLDFIDIASKVKDTLEIIALVSTGLSALFAAISADGFAVGIAESALALVALLDPIGWVIVGIVGLTIAIVAYLQSNKDIVTSSEKVQDGLSGVGDTAKGAIPYVKQYGDTVKKLAGISPLEFPQLFKIQTNTQSQANSTTHAQAPCLPQQNISTEDYNPPPDLDNSFHANLDKMHKWYDPENARFSIQASTESVSANAASTSDDAGKINDEASAYGNLGGKINQATDASSKFNKSQDETSDLIKELQDVAVSTFTTIGQALGQMTTGKNNFQQMFQGLLSSLAKALGDYIEKKGEMLLKAGIADIVAGTGLSAVGDPQGPVLIGQGSGETAAGAGLTVAGAAIGAIKMATGGVVSGSTFANIGEYAGASHNPEVVAPLDKLRSMIGGGGGSHQFSFQIAGDNLLSIQDRVQNNNQFVMGTNNQ